MVSLRVHLFASARLKSVVYQVHFVDFCSFVLVDIVANLQADPEALTFTVTKSGPSSTARGMLAVMCVFIPINQSIIC